MSYKLTQYDDLQDSLTTKDSSLVVKLVNVLLETVAKPTGYKTSVVTVTGYPEEDTQILFPNYYLHIVANVIKEHYGYELQVLD